MNKIRLGVIGFGQRGSNVTEVVLLKNKDIEVVAVCDEYADRVEAGLSCQSYFRFLRCPS